MDRPDEIRRARTGARQRNGATPARWQASLLAGLVAVAAIGILFVGATVAYRLVHSNHIFPGVRLGNVDVGGMTREKALTVLRPVYQERSARPILLRGPGADRQASAAELGATFDANAAVEEAYRVGRTGGWGERLSAQWGALVRGHTVESSGAAVDRPKLQSYLARLAQEIDRPVEDAELVIGEDLRVRVTPSVVGRKLDVAGAASAIERAIVTASATVDLPVTETQPTRVEKDLEEARARVSRMLSGPVALEFQGRRWDLSLEDIASLISVEQKPGVRAPTVTLRDESLKKLVEQIAADIDQPKSNARYDWNGGNLKLLRPGQDGRKLDRTKTLEMLSSAISGEQKVVALPVEVDKAAGGSLDPASLGIKERIEYGQTTIAGVPEKVHNIKLAASRLNGVLVGPGEMFSFNRELGPTTLKSGFQIGFGISVNNGEMQTVPSVAGGICQVATTLLHAVFWAGYQIEERYPHLYWIASYGQPPRGMVGLDATVDDPVLDLKFINNTENYLLIQSRVEGNTLEFALYGTKPNWKVEVEGPFITNVVKADPKTVRQEEPTWEVGRELWVERATDGMDVEIIRRVTQGNDVRTLNLKSKYQPSRNVLMVGTKKPEAAPGQGPGATATPGGGGQPTPAPAPAATPTRR
ncbi:MAG: VanW family protein [Sphingomonadaceae bacterium]